MNDIAYEEIYDNYKIWIKDYIYLFCLQRT